MQVQACLHSASLDCNTAYMLRSDKEYLPCHPRHCLLIKTVEAIVHVVILLESLYY